MVTVEVSVMKPQTLLRQTLAYGVDLDQILQNAAWFVSALFVIKRQGKSQYSKILHRSAQLLPFNKVSSKIIEDDMLIYYFFLYFSEKIKLDISCESSARLRLFKWVPKRYVLMQK